jgi:hypothetical protein
MMLPGCTPGAATPICQPRLDPRSKHHVLAQKVIRAALSSSFKWKKLASPIPGLVEGRLACRSRIG